jgi:hypothetical protein
MWLLVVAAGAGLVIADKLLHGWPGGCSTGVDGDPLAAMFGAIMFLAATITLVTIAVLDGRSSTSDPGPPRVAHLRGPARWRARVVPALAITIGLGGFWMFFVANTDFLVLCRPA